MRIKSKLDLLTKIDSRGNYILRLCQPETEFSRAIGLIRQLDHRRLRTEGEDLEECELDAFGGLAVTINFIHSLAQPVQLPSVNRKSSQEYVSGL